MEATLKFNLPDEQVEFNDAINGAKWQFIVYELDQWLRTNTKYAPDSQNGEYTNALVVAREQLHEYLNEEGLKLC